MIRLGISTEGATEREFVSRVLRPHLAAFGIQATGVDLRGNVSLDKIRPVLPALLGSFDVVSSMYDFYQFKGRDNRSIDELEAAILALVSQEQQARFIPYVQRYEFEALLFSVPEQTVSWLQGSAATLVNMQEAVRRCGSPELVNDSPQTSPSHRMKSLFAGYDKKLHGPDIVELAGLAAIRSECPRFDGWLSRLESLVD
ncbi:DUF4276 family protein [Iodobacter sp. CM08]|uniref:DUF4276 family protein n=1 Tax=Iodobacter sp. CM08 TaxID=3085902 RepID=UPI0029815791|nr:DUF4276 family protein [Iodobacter sp. CM08]MDW5416742.1 DUF4276 family protein [Iodobacter sp. CM08]